MEQEKKDFRTPLARVMGLGASGLGTKHFWLQRITSLANLPLFYCFLFILLYAVGKGYDQVFAVVSNPFVSIIILLMLISGLYHMKLGIAVIIEDYIAGEKFRGFCLMLNSFICFVEVLLCIFAVLKINFGG